MSLRALRLAWLAAATLLLATACADAGVDAPLGAGADGAAGRTVVFGVLSDFSGSEVDRLRVVVEEEGRVVRDETLATPALSFPLEVRTSRLAPSAPVAVLLQAFAPGAEEPLVERRASTKVVIAFDAVLRMRLERECVPGAVVFDDIVSPACASGSTCIGAGCEDPAVSSGALLAYSDDWASPEPDDCTLSGDPPSVDFGMGENGSYEPLGASSEISVHGGLQGGFHVFAGVRTRGLYGGLARTWIRMDDGAGKVTATKSMEGFRSTPSGGCAATDIRYILPYENLVDATPQEKVAAIVGKAFHIDVRVVDEMGVLACDSRTVVVGDDVSIDD